MKRIYKQILVCLILVAILTLGLMTTVSAAKASEHEWTVSEDQQVLSNGTTEYAYYRTVSRYELNRARLHSYDGDVAWGEEGNCSVYANPDRPDVVWVADYDDCYLFVTDGGRASMDAWFVERDIQNFCVWDDSMVADLSLSLIQAMDQAVTEQAALRTVSVTELTYLPRYEITAHDSEKIFSTPYGVVYEWKDGSYYYVNYWTLDNSHFDANGNLSYREGVVTLTLLDASLTSQFVETLGEKMDHYVDMELEAEPTDFPIVIFWIFFIFVGFFLPIPFVVLGVVFANRKKWGYPNYWYTVVATGGLWMLTAGVLFVLLLCA